MRPEAGSDEGVLQELKRRRVVRVVVAYISLSIGMLLATDLALALFGGPDWLFRALLGTAAMGFPVTAVLSWTYDITPEGIVRTPLAPPAVPAKEATPPWAWAATVVFGLLLAFGSLAFRLTLR
jgi:hypothetical protein